MTRYAQNGGLTRFDTGGTHEQSPISGIPIGNNASVEENETKNGNFIYSNRIVLDENTVSQYNLPKSLVGKSVADATKFIDNKFKGRNDKISQSTKDIMLSKIAEAQEYMKPQEPEMEQQGLSEDVESQNQMAWGGFEDSVIGQGFGEDATGIQQSQAVGAGIGSLTTALDLGRTAFGKPMQDTSGNQASADVSTGGMIAGNTLKGASAGAALGPIGAGVGALVGGVVGLLGSRKEKKAALENSNNFAIKTNNQFSDNYAFGGQIDPSKGYHTMPDGTQMSNSEMNNQPINTINQVAGINTTPDNSDLRFNTKNIVRYQPGVTSGKDGTSGFYLYSKLPTDQGFNVERDREFIKQQNMGAVQRTPQWQSYMKNKSNRVNPNINLNLTNPITNEYMYGGNVKKYEDGGYYENLKLTPRNTAPIKSQLDLSGLKSASTTVPYTIGTQPVVNVTNANRPIESGPSTLDMLKYDSSKVGSYLNKNVGNLARYAPIAMNAFQLSQLKKPQGEILNRLDNRYKPEYVDEAQLQNIANQTMNNTVNAISQSGASEGQNRASILGSQLQRTKALSDAYGNAAAQNRATDDRAQTFNLGVDQVNLQQSNTEKDINARDSAAYRNEKSKYLAEIGNAIGDVGKEEVYKKIAKTTTGYSWLGEYQKMNPNATPEETEKAAKKAGVLTDGTTKKALGGYLLKNK